MTVLVLILGTVKSVSIFWLVVATIVIAAMALVIWREAESRLRDWRSKPSRSFPLTRHVIHSRLARINAESLWADDPYLQFDFEIYSTVETPIHLRGLTPSERITIAGTECQDAPRVLRDDVHLSQPGEFHSFSFKQSIRESLASRLKKELSEDNILRGSFSALKYDATFDNEMSLIEDCWINVYGDFAIRGPVHAEGASELLWPTAPVFINQAVYPGVAVQQH